MPIRSSWYFSHSTPLRLCIRCRVDIRSPQWDLCDFVSVYDIGRFEAWEGVEGETG